jgi:hypothetical protein
MRAYKWLEPDAYDWVTKRTWSTDGWTRMSRWSFRFIVPNVMQFADQTTGDLDRYRSRAHTADKLAQSLLPELWEVELAGGVKEKNDTLVARKGRLVQRVAAWNDATAKRLAEDWIYAARDHYAEALRAVGAEQGAARLGGLLAEATSPAAIGQAARRARDRATRLPRVVTLPLLIVATDAYEDEPGIVAAQKARDARLNGAVAAAALTEPDSGYREDQVTNEYGRMEKRVYSREYERMSEDLRVRLGLPAAA